jgi:hypothetical protein
VYIGGHLPMECDLFNGCWTPDYCPQIPFGAQGFIDPMPWACVAPLATIAQVAPPPPPCGITFGAHYGYVCLQSEGRKWEAVKADFTRVTTLILQDTKCLEWLGATVGSRSVQHTLQYYGRTLFAVADSFVFRKTGAPSTDLATQGDLGNSIIFNLEYWDSQGIVEMRDTVIHELAHLFGARGFHQGDGGNDRAQASNARLIRENCGKTLNAK